MHTAYIIDSVTNEPNGRRRRSPSKRRNDTQCNHTYSFCRTDVRNIVVIDYSERFGVAVRECVCVCVWSICGTAAGRLGMSNSTLSHDGPLDVNDAGAGRLCLGAVLCSPI